MDRPPRRSCFFCGWRSGHPPCFERCHTTIRYTSSYGAASYPGGKPYPCYIIPGDASELSNFSSSGTAAETSRPSIKMLKPAFVGSATAAGAKQDLSSRAYSKHKISWEAKVAAVKAQCAAEHAAYQAESEAKRAAFIDEHAALLEEFAARSAVHDKYMRRVLWLSCFIGICLGSLCDPRPSCVRPSNKDGQRGSGSCSKRHP